VPSEQAKQRFFVALGIPKPHSECWEWPKNRDPNGYGRTGAVRYGYHKRFELTHRLAFWLFKGDIPPGAFVCHVCDNPPCCNPAHLFLGNAAINNGDRKQKGRNDDRRGVRNHVAKLAEADVMAIRKSRLSGRTIAARYGLGESTVSQIRSGYLWPHLPVIDAQDEQPFKVFFDGAEPKPIAAELATRYAAGESMDALAEHFGTTRVTIGNALKRLGVQSRPGGLPRRPVVANGRSYPTIAAAMKGERMGYAAVLKATENPT